jgi:DNA-binding response OmpR family regulator
MAQTIGRSAGGHSFVKHGSHHPARLSQDHNEDLNDHETPCRRTPRRVVRSYDRTMDTSGAGPVLVVDDEPMVLEVVCRYLELDGHNVHQASDGDAALAWLAVNDPALVVLDVMLPGADGLTILRAIRDKGDVPVVLLTARAEEIDRVVGLELGADDYVVKPFSPRELTVRVRNLLRRANSGVGAGNKPVTTLRFDDLVLDPSAREVTVGGEIVVLTPKEFDLLHHLASSPRQVFSRHQLLDAVWASSPEYQDPATVTVHVGRLRQKIETDPEHPRRITTTWGVGYRFEP